MSLIEFRKEGMYIPIADVHIDPARPVKMAITTHGHADHVRLGHKRYMATSTAVPVIKSRLGSHISIKGMPYGESFSINGVKISFHPAGHVIGSAQVRVEYQGEIWVVSGDYKLENDGLSESFESVKCHTFITECTFGKPEFDWKPQEMVYDEINQWWKENNTNGITSILSSYALGKSQRIINNLDHSIGTVYTHGAIENVNEVIRRQGIKILPTTRVKNSQSRKVYKGGLIIAPSPSVQSGWIKRFGESKMAKASGWPSRRENESVFELSDHADYKGLLQAIKLSECEKIYVVHGSTQEFRKDLEEKGYDAHIGYHDE